MKLISEKTAKWFIVAGFVLAALGGLYFIAKHFYFLPLDSQNPWSISVEKFGDFGGFIGGVIGVVWTLAGVILFYVSIRDQREDIKTNRETLKTQVEALNQQVKEFELQRKELELTRAVYEEQGRTLKLQQFETTFFNLLNSQQGIIEALVFEKAERISTLDTQGPSARQGQVAGIKVLELAKADFDTFYWSPDNKGVLLRELAGEVIEYLVSGGDRHVPPRNTPTERIKFKYRIFFEIYHQALGHYFRHLFQILHFLKTTMDVEKRWLEDRQGISKEYTEKKFQFYANIVQSKLSSDELFLLFYNSICFPKMKELISTFKLLENLAIEDLIEEGHKDLYPEIQFKRRASIMS